MMTLPQVSCHISFVDLERDIIHNPQKDRQKGYADAILMDLSKASDCLDHELLLAKLESDSFRKNALCVIYSYLTGRKQRVLVNGASSERE